MIISYSNMTFALAMWAFCFTLKCEQGEIAEAYLRDSKSNADSTDPHQIFQQEDTDCPEAALRRIARS